MLEVLNQAALISAILTIFLLLYCIIVEAIESIKLKRNVHSSPYIKDFLRKLINTILIFYPLFFVIVTLICLIVTKITTEF